ncbi:DUF1413 domain-containing protein [Halomonas sp. AOP12-C2-37]|uniref:DUF1413 domain-containing protein n=1 Tax=unclassified Halomonas TaxID=2609666 RepID=UPI00403488AE
MKKPMTVRLHQETLDKLNVIASGQGVTRQDLVEMLLEEATGETVISDTDKIISHVSQSVLDDIRKKSLKLNRGSEISLKRLVGEGTWESFTDATKRIFGKQFREMVVAGDFPTLSVGHKKSNNEQQYVVL